MFEASVKARQFSRGQTVEGTLVGIGPKVGFVNIGGKGEAEIDVAGTVLEPRAHGVARGSGLMLPGLGESADAEVRFAYDGAVARARAEVRSRAGTLLELTSRVDTSLLVDQALTAARAEPAPKARSTREIGPGRTGLAQGPAFQVEQLAGAQSGQLNPPDRELWLIALEGGGQVAEHDFGAGEVWYLDGGHPLKLDPGSRILIAYPGQYRADVWRPD